MIKNRITELQEKWKIMDFDVIHDEERAHYELSMMLGPFTSDEAEKRLEAAKKQAMIRIASEL